VTQSFCISAGIGPRDTSSARASPILPSQRITEPHNKQRGKPTVGSDPTSCVTPAVSPTALLRIFRKTHEDVASSEYWQVLHANCNRWVSGSSLGYSMFELWNISVGTGNGGRRIYHSLQKRKVICSIFFFWWSSPVLDAGDAMMEMAGSHG
jgi:hypothetical protein